MPAYCIALYYHGVNINSKDKFDKQMIMLEKYTIPISVYELKKMESGKRYSLVTFDDGFSSVIKNALPILSKRNIPNIIFIPTDYIGEVPGWIVPNKNNSDNFETVINQEQIKEISKDSITTIGSHSKTHCDFLFTNENQAYEEIFGSKKKLESILKKEIDAFSFPHGNYTQDHINLCKQAGYKYIFSITPKKVFIGTIENVISRFHVQPDDWHLEFYLKLTGAYNWLPTAFSIKKNMKNLFFKKKVYNK